MTPEQHKKIIALISKQTNKSVFAASHLYDDLDFDQFDMIELCVDLEEVFNIDILDEEVDDWKTVADVVRSVETRL